MTLLAATRVNSMRKTLVDVADDESFDELSKRTESIADLAPDWVFLMDHKERQRDHAPISRSALRGRGPDCSRRLIFKNRKNHRNYHPQSLSEVMLSGRHSRRRAVSRCPDSKVVVTEP